MKEIKNEIEENLLKGHFYHIIIKETKGIFGNCFFPLFSVSNNNFIFFRLKNLFGNPKWTKKQKLFSKLNL